MMNFLVSPYAQARLDNATRLFAANDYVVHVLQRTGQLANYEEVVVAPQSRTTREAFATDHDFVDRKYRQYVPILTRRLNELHGTKYDERFWQKSLSLALLRHITLCYDLFQSCEMHFRPGAHQCRILSESSFFVPRDFNEHRRFFQHTDYGQEQLFSVYCRLFHAGPHTEWDDRHLWPPSEGGSRTSGKRRRWIDRLNPKRLARRLLRFRSPTVGIVNSYFSQDNLDSLLFESAGRIQSISLPELSPASARIDWAKRTAFSRADEQFDRFDRFVFATLRHGMPRAFVEDAPALISELVRTFTKYSKLTWVISEAWIGDMHSAMALAVLGKRGVRHLYNEHNYFTHPFLGSNLKYILSMVDEYVTLGWQSPDAKVVAGASLFPWVEGELSSDASEILYVSSLPQVRAPEISACYGEAGPVNVPQYLQFVRSFLDGLSDTARSELVFRSYPPRYTNAMQAYDLRQALGDRLRRVKRVDDFSPSARALMCRAKLVIVDYLSTAYLEALLLNVPTVFFWNMDAYYVEEAHRGFFDVLVSAQICHTDPNMAADFVESIREEPQRWWRSEAVQAARTRFLRENMGEARTMIDHLVRRSRMNPPNLTLVGCT